MMNVIPINIWNVEKIAHMSDERTINVSSRL